MARHFEFEVSLLEIEPRIWRRFLLPEDATFLHLHEAIQDAGPWENAHMSAFYELSLRGKGKKARLRQGECLATMSGDRFMVDSMFAGERGGGSGPRADRVPLAGSFREPGDRCLYVYDFGDGWEHLVELKQLVELPNRCGRRLLDGARAFPPEDCGGVGGYYDAMVAVGAVQPEALGPDAPSEEDLEERREWLGDWDPEAFNLAKAKRRFDG